MNIEFDRISRVDLTLISIALLHIFHIFLISFQYLNIIFYIKNRLALHPSNGTRDSSCALDTNLSFKANCGLSTNNPHCAIHTILFLF